MVRNAMFGCLLALACPMAARAEIPPILNSSEPQQTLPVFVSADAAIDADGNLDSKLFYPEALINIQSLLEMPPSPAGCVEIGPTYIERVSSRDRSTLELAAQSSSAVLVGRVVGREFGINYMTPGQLLEVEPVEVLAGGLAKQNYFTFLPIGDFELAGVRLCKSDSRYPAPPQLGDRVLLMLPRVASDPADQYLNLREPTSIVVLDGGGEVRGPALGKDHVFTSATSAAELLLMVRAAVEEGR